MNYYAESLKRFPDKIRVLQHSRRLDSLAHAWLIQADLASTRENFALALAQIAGCINPVSSGAPCGVCPSCRRIENNGASALFSVNPEGKMYEIKVGKFPNPDVNTIRYFTENFYLSNNQESHMKIGVIYDADRMNNEAQNALLKTLEEPPPESMIILVSGNPGMLLPTTLSRCQILPLTDLKIPFDFAGVEKLYPALYQAFNNCGDLSLLEKSAAQIIEIAANLKKAAEDEAMCCYEDKLSQAKELDDKLVKRLTKAMEDAGSGLYIRQRRLFLCAIESFFSQLLLLSHHAELSQLPNPEMFNGLDLSLSINEKRAAAAVEAAGRLIYSFYFPVNEPLAIRGFIFNFGQI